ncbi:MAG TPA: glycosyltransferase family 2 protein [Phycisphaerales bacterium]|nr:glycosyltransferase family 2 protein [Phycisphaerales bacterium]
MALPAPQQPGAAPALAFVVPAFNAAHTIERTLRSLARQTRADFELVVVDDGSTDQTAARVAACIGSDPRSRLLPQPNAGVAAARARGLAATTAPAVCFLDADDWIHPRFAAAMLDLLARTRADVAACSYRFAAPDARDLGWTVRLGPADATPARLLEFNPFCTGGTVYRRRALEPLFSGGRPLVGGTSRHEDWELLLAVSARGGTFAVSSRPLFTYRISPGSRSDDALALWRDGLGVIRSHAPEGYDLDRALRHWGLRSLAAGLSAAVRTRHHPDPRANTAAPLAPFLAGLLPLRDADVGLLAASLAFTLCRRHAIAPHRAAPHARPWARAVRDLLATDPLAGLVAARLTLALDVAGSWGRIAQRAAAEVPPGGRVVVYGLGRAGRQLAGHLLAAGTSTAFIDDNPGAALGAPRLTPAELHAADLVIVTPQHRESILVTLAGTPARVFLPEALLHSPPKRTSARPQATGAMTPEPAVVGTPRSAAATGAARSSRTVAHRTTRRAPRA